MHAAEMKELSTKARADAHRLFAVSQLIYTLSIILCLIIAMGGIITSLSLFQVNVAGGFVSLLQTAAYCAAVYFIAVLATQIAKVVSHTSLAAIAVMENESNPLRNGQAAPRVGGSEPPAHTPTQTPMDPPAVPRDAVEAAAPSVVMTTQQTGEAATKTNLLKMSDAECLGAIAYSVLELKSEYPVKSLLNGNYAIEYQGRHKVYGSKDTVTNAIEVYQRAGIFPTQGWIHDI